MESKILDELKKHLETSPTNTIDFQTGDEVVFVSKENRKSPGEPIFVREDGKVGFPTFNSISFNTGDKVRGRVKIDRDTCFFIEVYEIIENAKEVKDDK